MEKTARQKTYDQISEMTQPEITELVLDLREQIERWKLRVDVLTDLSEVSRLEGLVQAHEKENDKWTSAYESKQRAIERRNNFIQTLINARLLSGNLLEEAMYLTTPATLSRASSKEETQP